jgi:hypothetical protein
MIQLLLDVLKNITVESAKRSQVALGNMPQEFRRLGTGATRGRMFGIVPQENMCLCLFPSEVMCHRTVPRGVRCLGTVPQVVSCLGTVPKEVRCLGIVLQQARYCAACLGSPLQEEGK